MSVIMSDLYVISRTEPTLQSGSATVAGRLQSILLGSYPSPCTSEQCVHACILYPFYVSSNVCAAWEQ